MQRARAIGIETVFTPVHASQANALAERVIGTIGRECLDHLIVLNEAHLRRVLRSASPTTTTLAQIGHWPSRRRPGLGSWHCSRGEPA